MKVRMMSIGDVLVDLTIVKAAKDDYSMIFENMKDTFAKADLLTLNQEVMLSDEIKPTGFPVMSGSATLIKAEEDIGFDLATCATNHSLDHFDKGMSDMVRCFAKNNVIKQTGIGEIGKENEAVIIEKNGIKIAFLAYTKPLNSHFNVPFFKYYVEILKPWRRNHIAEQIKKAREKADFVVVMPHWGIEYLYAPVDNQKMWANFFAEQGADLIIGTHPHVIQPLEEIETKDGRKVPVFWSLGNYVSSIVRPGTMLGGMADVVFEKDENGKRISSTKLVPLVASSNSDLSYFTVYTLDDYPDELSKDNKIFQLIESEFKEKTNKESLAKLYDGVLDGSAQRENPLQNHGDVRRYNFVLVSKTIINKLTGKKQLL